MGLLFIPWPKRVPSITINKYLRIAKEVERKFLINFVGLKYQYVAQGFDHSGTLEYFPFWRGQGGHSLRYVPRS